MKRGIAIFVLSLIVVALLVSLSCGSCGKKESTEASKTETVSPPPQDQPSEPPVYPRAEIQNLSTTWLGNRYYTEYYTGSRNRTNYWDTNNGCDECDYYSRNYGGKKYSSSSYGYNSDRTAGQYFQMGDDIEICFDIVSTGNTAATNLSVEVVFPFQFNIQSGYINSYKYGQDTAILLDRIGILKPREVKHYCIRVLLCNSNSQYDCYTNVLQSMVILKGNGADEKSPFTVTVWRECDEYRGPCYYSSCCTSCTSCPSCPTPETPCPPLPPVVPPPCPPQPPVVPPPAPPAPQPEPCIPEPVIPPPPPPAPGQQPIFQPGGSSPGGSSGGSGGPLPNSAIP